MVLGSNLDLTKSLLSINFQHFKKDFFKMLKIYVENLKEIMNQIGDEFASLFARIGCQNKKSPKIRFN